MDLNNLDVAKVKLSTHLRDWRIEPDASEVEKLRAVKKAC